MSWVNIIVEEGNRNRFNGFSSLVLTHSFFASTVVIADRSTFTFRLSLI